MDSDERAALGMRVLSARLSSGLGKEGAARFAGVSSITWKRVEDGLPVRDYVLAAVIRATEKMSDPDADAPASLRRITDADLLAEMVRRFGGTDTRKEGGPGGDTAAMYAAERASAELDRLTTNAKGEPGSTGDTTGQDVASAP